MPTKTTGKGSSTKKAAGSSNKGGSGAKRPTGGKQAAEASNRLLSVLLLAAAVLLLCAAFIPGAGLWTALHELLFSLFGFCAYLWPLLLLLLSVLVSLDGYGKQGTRLASAAAFLLALGAAIHIFTNEESYLLEERLWSQAQGAWDAVSPRAGGGFFGALFGAALGKLGKTPAAILVLLGIAVLLMLLTGTTHITWLRALFRGAKRAKTSLAEHYEEQRLREEERDAEWQIWELEHERAPLRIGPGKPVQLPILPVGDPLDGAGGPDFPDSPERDFIPTLDTAPVSPPGAALSSETGMDELLGQAAEKKRKPKKKEAETAPEEIFVTPPHYRLPPIELLSVTERVFHPGGGNIQNDLTGQKLIETLNSFNVSVEIVAISRGPSVTRYEVEPKPGIRINKITQLADDIALRLAASGVRIEAPIPNKSAIGIEVPNKQKSTVGMREIIGSPLYQSAKSKLNVALGKDISGNIICADLARMPHLLIAGTTGSGKSVCMNTMIISILYNATPDEVKLIMIDPKQVEFTVYNGIAHLALPVVSDPRKAAGTLAWAVSEMGKRYKLFAEKNVRDITGYNKLADKSEELARLHHIVIFIDELSDLMMIAPNEVEDSICRLAQMARAAGMHLVIATQRPSVDVITGIIKANIPSRVALSVSSQVDSRTILDMAGAEKLLGYGDMLFNPVGISKPVRVQGCFISDQEVEAVVRFVTEQLNAEYDEAMMEEVEKIAAQTGQKKKGSAAMDSDGGDGEKDDLFDEAVRVVVEAEMASTTLLQRKLKLGYARASRIMDELEERGVVGPFEGSKPRKVLISKRQFLEMQALGSDDYAAEENDGEEYEDEDDGDEPWTD